MQFNPPLINNIEDVLPYIKDNPAFIVVNKGWYTVIDYVYAHRDTFTNDFARECRGLKFCSTTGNILARPCHKFHNLGECAGYFEADVDLSLEHDVLEKLDGSMVHFALDPDGRPWPMTRMGVTNVAEMAHDYLIGRCLYGQAIYNLVTNNPTSTFIFEYVGPHNRIVVSYPEERLILTAIRDIYTGAYQPFMTMQALLIDTDIPLVAHYPMGNGYQGIYDDPEDEGAVIRFASGGMVKIKAERYVRRHKTKELTDSVKGVVQLLVDDNLDDILPLCEPAVADRLLDYQRVFHNRLDTLHEGIRHILSLMKHWDQKEFALNVQANYTGAMRTALFMTRKSGNGRAELENLIAKRYTKENDLIELMNNLEIPLWQF